MLPAPGALQARPSGWSSPPPQTRPGLSQPTGPPPGAEAGAGDPQGSRAGQQRIQAGREGGVRSLVGGQLAGGTARESVPVLRAPHRDILPFSRCGVGGRRVGVRANSVRLGNRGPPRGHKSGLCSGCRECADYTLCLQNPQPGQDARGPPAQGQLQPHVRVTMGTAWPREPPAPAAGLSWQVLGAEPGERPGQLLPDPQTRPSARR